MRAPLQAMWLSQGSFPLSSQSRFTISHWEGQTARIFYTLQLQAEEDKFKVLVSVAKSIPSSTHSLSIYPWLYSRSNRPRTVGPQPPSPQLTHWAQVPPWESSKLRRPEATLVPRAVLRAVAQFAQRGEAIPKKEFQRPPQRN